MASTISEVVNQIRTDVYGKDMRQHIADGFSFVYNTASGTSAIAGQAKDKAIEALNKAAEAWNKANTALTDAGSAKDKADDAYAVAGRAEGKADGAVATAETAAGFANQAREDANKALRRAEAATQGLDLVDALGLYVDDAGYICQKLSGE